MGCRKFIMKRSILKITLGVLAIIVFFLAVWIVIVVVRIPSHVIPDTKDWHTGDVFFSVGDSWKSVAVRSISGAKNLELSELTPSHCGIVVVDSGKLKLVHESTSAKRIVMETPDEYLHNNGSFCLYARKPPCVPDSVRIVQIIDSLMKVGVPFDFNFDHTEDKSLYCTEMVVRVFELCGCNEFSNLREQGYIYPQDLRRIIK